MTYQSHLKQTTPIEETFFTKPTFIEVPLPHISESSGLYVTLTLDFAPQMDLSTQINSLSTRMKEIPLISGCRFYSLEDEMDQYQFGFTSQYENLATHIKSLTTHLDHFEATFIVQHDELKVLLINVFISSSLALIVLCVPSFLFYIAKGGNISIGIYLGSLRTLIIDQGHTFGRTCILFIFFQTLLLMLVILVELLFIHVLAILVVLTLFIMLFMDSCAYGQFS